MCTVFTLTGELVLGQSYTITCSVEVAEGLRDPADANRVMWTDPDDGDGGDVSVEDAVTTGNKLIVFSRSPHSKRTKEERTPVQAVFLLTPAMETRSLRTTVMIHQCVSLQAVSDPPAMASTCSSLPLPLSVLSNPAWDYTIESCHSLAHSTTAV